MKKLLSLITAAIMMFAFATTAMAATVGSDTDLISAITNATDGEEITLTSNITVTDALVIDEDITINVDVYTLKVADITVDENVTLTLDGSSSGGYGYLYILGDAIINGDFLSLWTVHVGEEYVNATATMTIGENGSYANSDDLYIYGKLINKGDFESGSAWGWVYNYGTITNTGTIENEGDFINACEFNNSGTIKNSGTFTNNYTFYNYDGSTFDNSGGTLESYSGFNNYDEFNNDNGVVNSYGEFCNGSDSDRTATVSNDGGLLHCTYYEKYNSYLETYSWVAGSIKNYGTIDNDNGVISLESLNVYGSVLNSATESHLYNYGTITGGDCYSNAIGSSIVAGTATVHNYAVMDGSGTEIDPYQIDSAEQLAYFLTQDIGEYGQLTDDITYDLDTLGYMKVTQTKDLNMSKDETEYTIQIPNETTTEDWAIYITGGDLTMYNGTFIAGEWDENYPTTSQGCHGLLTTDASSSTFDIHDMTVYSAYSGKLCIYVYYGDDNCKVTDCTFYAYMGGILEAYDDVSVTNSVLNQNLMTTQTNTWASSAVAVSYGATATVTGGTYTNTGYGAYVYSGGGTINIYGGDWQASTAVLKIDKSGSTINVYGGTFDGVFSLVSGANLNLYGGTFTVDPSAYVADGYSVKTLADGSYYVTPEATVTGSDGNFVYAGTLAGAVTYANALDDDGIVLSIFEDTGVIGLSITNGMTITGVADAEGNLPTVQGAGGDVGSFEVKTNEQVIFENLDFIISNRAISVYHDTHTPGATANSTLNADIIVRNCVISAGGKLIDAGEGSEELGYTLLVEGCTFEGLSNKAIHIALDANDSFTFTNNTMNNTVSGDASAFTVITLAETSKVSITNNTFTNYYRVICADHSTAQGSWTITDNILISTSYILNYDSTNNANADISVAYNFNTATAGGTGTVVGLLDEATTDDTSKIITYPYYKTNADGELDDLYYGVASVTSGDEFTYFGTLANAVAYAGDGDTITLLENVEVSESINIYDGANITIEGDGKTITSKIVGDDAANAIFVAEIGYDNNTADREVTVSLHNIVFEQSTKAPVIAGGYYNLSLFNVSIEDCVFNGTSSELCWVISSTSIGTLNFINNEVNGDYYKPIYAVVSMPDYTANITITGNTFTGKAGNNTAGGITINLHNQYADMEDLDTAKIIITGNTFENRNKVICIDSCASSAFEYDFGDTLGSWTITGNKFINVNYALNYDSDNTANDGISMAYNFFGTSEDATGTVVGLMDEQDESSYSNPVTTNLTLYPYYADEDLTTLVYLSEDGVEEETSVETAVADALDTALSTDVTSDELAAAIEIVTAVDNSVIVDNDMVDLVNDLDAALLASYDEAGGTLKADASITTVDDEDIANETDIDNADLKVSESAATEVKGLALAVVGNEEIEEGTTVTVTLNIAQTAASVTETTDEETGDTSTTIAVTYEISPTKTVYDGINKTETDVANEEISAPITFTLHLPSIFDDTNRATLTHKDGDTIYTEDVTYVVYHDDTDSYITITTTHFSEFVVTLADNVSTSSSSVKKYSNDLEVGDGGSAYATPLSASSGTTVYINVSPDTGYEVDEVIVDGGDIDVTDCEDGTYSYKQPAYAVDIEVTFQADGTVEEEEVEEEVDETEALTDFDDVVAGAWYEEYIAAAVEEGIMQGNSETEFAPNGTTTRAMMIQVLFNMSDEPETENDESAWYSEALAWGMEFGITDGSEITGDLTREQLVTMLYRYAMSNGVDVSVGEDTNILSYNDALEVADWAMEAFQWACGEGIINGDTDGNLNPQGNATRAELAKIMVSYLGE